MTNGTQSPVLAEPPMLDTAAMTAETVDLKRFYMPQDLECMPTDALEELWQACPDKDFYETALDQAIRGEYGDAALDLDRLSIIDQSLDLYHRVPPKIPAIRRSDGTIKWFQVSDRVREHVETGSLLEVESPAAQSAGGNYKARLLAIPAMVIFAILMMVLLLGDFGGSKLSEEEAAATATADAAYLVALGETPTPTPLALDNIDQPISAGDNVRGYYPVTLEIIPAAQPDGSRVFPVQQKRIDVAQWEYDSNPEIASSVFGLVIRPVIGIPYSPANSVFLTNLQAGDQIRLTMNTGRTLQFDITHNSRLPRQDVSIFEQAIPGIVLVMLGDQSGDRLAVFGTYPAQQETILTNTSASGSTHPIGEVISYSDTGVAIQVSDVYASSGPSGAQLSSAWTYLLVDLQISTTKQVKTSAFQIKLVDGTGAEYAPVSVDPSITHHSPYAYSALLEDSQQNTTLGFLIPSHINRAVLNITVPSAPTVSYQLEYAAPSGLTTSNLDVLVMGMELTHPTEDSTGQISIRLRLFNPHGQAITVSPGDIYAVFSPVVTEDAFPVGPATQPTDLNLPLTIQPGEARDLTFSIQWNGDPFMGLAIGGYQYIAALEQPE